jgi:hypothetical protein
MAIAGLIIVATPATAYGYATLVSCRSANTSSGRTVWVGTYRLGSRTFVQYFENYCPTMIEAEVAY